MDITVNGVSRPMTAEEIAEWEADQANYIPPPAIIPTLSLQQVASAKLVVQDWEVAGLEFCHGIAGAFLLDTDLAMVIFDQEFPDCEYIVMPPEGETKYPGHVEVTRPGLTAISFIIMRVQ